MARISDIIAQFINDMIEDEKNKEVIIQRNELADKFNCAPSQINYVLTTRFTTEKGYLIDTCLNSQDNYEKLAKYFLED